MFQLYTNFRIGVHVLLTEQVNTCRRLKPSFVGLGREFLVHPDQKPLKCTTKLSIYIKGLQTLALGLDVALSEPSIWPSVKLCNLPEARGAIKTHKI